MKVFGYVSVFCEQEKHILTRGVLAAVWLRVSLKVINENFLLKFPLTRNRDYDACLLAKNTPSKTEAKF